MINISIIIWVIVHMLIAFVLNATAQAVGLIDHSEIFTVYFVILACKKYNEMLAFWIQYNEDPDLTEQLLRSAIGAYYPEDEYE